MEKTAQPRPFGLRDKIGYLFGDFGNDFTFILSTVILSKFYTDVMGVSAGVVGTVMMLARAVDAVTDLSMGRLCDRSRPTPAGKFKPWLLRLCVPVAAASFLLYQSGFAGRPMGFKIAYLAVTYILWGSFCYTGINIPYGSMASAISPEPADRQSLSTFRTMGGMLAGLIIGMLVPLLCYQAETLPSGGVKQVLVGSRVTLAAGVCSVLAIACYLLCYALVTERVRPKTARRRLPFGALWRSALENRPLLAIIAASTLMLLAQLTMQNMSSYIYPDYYGSAAAQSASTALMLVGMALAALTAKPLAQRFGKAELSAAGGFFAAAVCLGTFFLRPGSVWVYCVLQMLCWLGLGLFSMVNWALITDVIDYAELKNGVREDGTVYALYSFARKVGQSLAAGLSGWLLQRIGYSTAAAQAGQPQPSQVLAGMFNISTLVPFFGFLALSLVLAFWYPLRKAQVEANVAALREKHGDA